MCVETVYGWYKLQLEIRDMICLSQQRKKDYKQNHT